MPTLRDQLTCPTSANSRHHLVKTPIFYEPLYIGSLLPLSFIWKDHISIHAFSDWTITNENCFMRFYPTVQVTVKVKLYQSKPYSPLDGLWVQLTQRMVFGKVRSDEPQVKRNSPRRHKGIHMYQHQVENCSLLVKLELKKHINRDTFLIAYNNL